MTGLWCVFIAVLVSFDFLIVIEIHSCVTFIKTTINYTGNPQPSD